MPSHGMPWPAVELEDPAGDVVEEVAIVGDGDDGARILLEEALEPGHRLGVEMVGRLVEQQHVGLLQQEPAQRDAAPLAAGELRDLGVARRQAQRVHRDLDGAIELPGVDGVDLVLQPRLLLEQLLHLVVVERLAELGADLLEAREQSARRRPRPPRRCRARPWSGRARAPAADSRSCSPSAGNASPRKSLSTPAMMRSSVRLPAPLAPSTPILAPGRTTARCPSGSPAWAGRPCAGPSS